jgi:hypothetical protein
MQVNTTPEITFPKTGALGPYLRVVMTGGLLALADANDREIGTLRQNYLASGLGQGNFANVISRHAPGTVMMIASGAITQFADVYADVLGKVTGNPTGYYIGMAMTTVTANGDQVEVLRVDDRGGMLFINPAVSNVITNTVAETAFNKSVTFAANTLKVGDFIHVIAHVACPATNSTDTLTLKLKIGATVVIATAAVDVANGDIALIDAIFIVRTIGAAGTFVAVGTQGLGTPGTVTAKPFNLASTVIDTTAAQQITVTATWSVANAGDQAQMDIFAVNRNGG